MKGTFIESLDVHELSENDLFQISNVEKDLWSYGIGEYVKCSCCGLIHSKNDIFGHLSGEIKKESVSKLEEIFLGDSIRCVNCNSDTEFIYDTDNNVLDIKKRLFETKASFLSVMRDEKSGNIVGFMDGYIDDLFKIYENEFSSHYNEEGFHKIKEFFKNIISLLNTDELMTISSLGTIEKFTGLRSLLELMNNYSLSIPEKYINNIGIAEFDSGSNIHSFFHAMGFKKINMGDSIDKNNKYINYNSGIYYLPELIKVHRESFNLSIRDFIKNHGYKMKEV